MDISGTKNMIIIQLPGVEAFEEIVEDVALAGARRLGGRRFVVSGSTFSYEQVCALMRLASGPARRGVTRTPDVGMSEFRPGFDPIAWFHGGPDADDANATDGAR